MRRLILLFSTLLTGNIYAGQLQSTTQFQNNGGLFDHISPLLVPERNASDIQNITMDDRGQLSKRAGYIITNSTGTLGVSTSTVNGGAYSTPSSGTNFFAVIIGTHVYRTANTFSGSYSDITGSVTLTDKSSNLAQATAINDVTIFCNDLDKPFYVGASGNAVTISTNTFDKAKTCATYGNYLVASNTTESSVAFPSRVRWSDINNQNSFPVLNYIDVEPNDGDSIVSTISYEDAVYIFKKRSIYKMLITGLDGPDAFIIRPVARNIGAWAKNSVKVIPNVGIAFLAQNAVYTLSGNYNEVYQSNGITAIGDPIQRTFDNVTRNMWGNAVASIYPHRYQYWLAVSTTPDSQNHEVLVYDYIQKAWTIYSDINANMLAQSEDSTGQNILISGDYNANIYKQDTGTSDNPKNVATAIDAYYTTANNVFGTADITKNFKYLYVFSLVDVNTTVTISAAYDYNTSFETNTDIALGTVSAIYDTAIYDQDIYPAAGYRVSRIELNRSARAIRLKFANSDIGAAVGVLGWTIVYSNEDWRQ